MLKFQCGKTTASALLTCTSPSEHFPDDILNFLCREISQGPHYDELQELFESFWIPDMTSPEQLLLQFDLTIIPDPVLAKYMVESFYEKEAKVAKSKTYYANLIKQPWGVIDAYPPKERYEYERIKNLSRQKWIRKFPPLATVGEEAYQRLKSHSQVAGSHNTNHSF